ncbi:MAG TPA: prolipoprotein diacylglyceryl transferase [Candidatus Methylomirabilis sp.]
MRPIFVELGPFSIRFYGLMYIIGILLALVMLRREARRKGLPLTEDEVLNLIMLLVFGGILGARLYYVAFNWDYYWAYPWAIPAVWQGGLAIHGGLLGGLLAGAWFVRRHRIPLWRLGDTIAPNLILGQALGRFGNFMNGDAHGVPTDLPWGLVFAPNTPAGMQFGTTPLHPVMLYEMAIDLGIFAVLWRLRTRSSRDGFLFGLYVLLYSGGRFVVEVFRADSLLLGPFRAAQVVSLLAILGVGVLLWRGRLWAMAPQPQAAPRSGQC